MPDLARDQTGPHIIQLSFFLPNRLGALLRATRRLEEENVRLCAISILDAADHAVVRMVVNRPAVARSALVDQGYNVFETELLGVVLSDRHGMNMQKVLAALLMAEVNVQYVYSLMTQARAQPVLALHVEDVRTAERVLRQHGLELVGQDEIDPAV